MAGALAEDGLMFLASSDSITSGPPSDLVDAIGRIRNVVDGGDERLWQAIGHITDEFKNADFQPSRADIDRRAITTNNGSVPWSSVTQPRGYLRDASSMARRIRFVMTFICNITTSARIVVHTASTRRGETVRMSDRATALLQCERDLLGDPHGHGLPSLSPGSNATVSVDGDRHDGGWP